MSEVVTQERQKRPPSFLLMREYCRIFGAAL